MPTIIVNSQHNKNIDLSGAQSSGGQTGSVRIALDADYYQYKYSITENSLLRKAKAFLLDRENFGELLASRIVKKYDETIYDSSRVPNIYFVTDYQKPTLAIASQYLKGEMGSQVMSLDHFLYKPENASHIKLIADQTNTNKGHYNINEHPILKKELAHAIALSALVSDHDVNPGNMIIIKEQDNSFRLSRIDYGHAFNDLMRFSSFGGKRVHTNNIIDFFNRATIDGVGANSKSKLWRDYPGMIPSKEMAEALKKISSQHDNLANNAIDEVRKELNSIFLAHKNIDKKQIIDSFQTIAEQISGKKIPSDMTIIFAEIKNYVSNNIKQMRYAAQIMELQTNIVEAIKDNKLEALPGLYEQYKQLVQEQQSGPFSWIKETTTQPPFKGTFDEYVNHQKQTQALLKWRDKIDIFLKNDPSPYEAQVMSNVRTIIMNTNISIDEKLQLIKHKIEQTRDSPLPKSNSFSQLINTFVNLFKTYCASITSIFTSTDQQPIQHTEIIQKNQNMKSVLSRMVQEHNSPAISQEQKKHQNACKEDDESESKSESRLSH